MTGGISLNIEHKISSTAILYYNLNSTSAENTFQLLLNKKYIKKKKMVIFIQLLILFNELYRIYIYRNTALNTERIILLYFINIIITIIFS